MARITINLETDKCNWKVVDIGIAAISALDKSKAPLGVKIKFRENCIKFVANIISKLKNHSTVKHKFTWAHLAL